MFSPITKIISLSALLALGFLLIILSCALYDTYYPLIDIAIFLLAPLPNAIFSRSKFDDFMSDSTNDVTDFAKFLTAMFVVSGLALPVVLFHSRVINVNTCAMAMAGGLIIYSTIVLFGWFFRRSEEDDEY